MARPLVIGEDPTLQASLQFLDPSGLLLTMFWLVAAALWGLWRLWARQGTWYGGAVEAALFAAVLLTCAGAAFVASYKHPARLMAWEWVAMGVGFVLLRQLAVSREDQHCFFAVLLAGAVPLSAYALYQRGVEIPKIQAQYRGDRDKLKQSMGEQGGSALDEAFLRAIERRIEADHVYGTFANPNSFAGYLALVVPGLVGAALLCARHKHPTWQVMLASCFATLGVVALALTHSRGAMLGMLCAGLGAAAVLWRGRLRRRWYYALAAAAVLALAGVGLWQTNLWTAGLGKSESTAAVRLEYWRNTWQMIREHPWFGVGPGQFSRYYTRYMAETDGETVKEPHNLVLEVWATCGVFAVLALLTVFALVYWKTLRALLAAPTVDGPGDLPPKVRGDGDGVPVRWEFYVGGMAGLILTFVLRAADKSPDDVVVEAVKAGVQSVLWFGSYALFEQIVWSDRARLLALLAGVTAALLNMLVSGGITYPSVATMFWCAVALALNAAGPAPNAWVSRFQPLLYAPLPALAAVAVLFLATEFYPVTESLSVLKRATADRLSLHQRGQSQPLVAGPAKLLLSPREIVAPLEKAQREVDPDDARLSVYLAEFNGELWFTSAREQTRGGMASAKSRREMGDPNSYIRKALYYAAVAQKLDPEGREGYLVEAELRRLFAWAWEMPEPLPAALGSGARFWQMTVNEAHPDYDKFVADRKEQYRLAAVALEKALKLDPNDAKLRYQLADTLYRAGKDSEAREHADRALQLDDRNQWPTRKLANEHRRQVERWLEGGTGR